MKIRIIMISIFVVWAIIIVCTFPFYRDYKAYRMVQAAQDESTCNWYLDLLPVGSYADTVFSIKDDIVYREFESHPDIHSASHYVESCPDGKHAEDVWYGMISLSRNKLVSINDYLQRYPEGRYARMVNALCDSLWDNEISNYNKRDRRLESPDAVKYILEMLQYMKKNRITKIGVNINSELQLKDFSEYSASSKLRACDYNTEDLREVEDKMVSIKKNFTSEDRRELVNILSEGIRRDFSSFFSTDFVDVVYLNGSKNDKEIPMINITYTIKTQEDDGCPHIWVYSSSYSDFGRSITQNYLLGISISFDARFSLPHSETVYDYREKGNPLKAQFDVKSISDGYRKMTKFCFENFSHKLSDNLGVRHDSK